MSDQEKPPADAAAKEDPTAEELRHDIEQTRDELGDTVEALAGKADVKAQAQARVDEVKDNVKANASQMKDDATAKVHSFTSKASDATPQSAGSGAQALEARVKENPLPFAIGAAIVIGFLLGRSRS